MYVLKTARPYSRSITASDSPDPPLLTSTLMVLFAVARAGSGVAAVGAEGGGRVASGTNASATSATTAAMGATATPNGVPSPELAALAKGGAWGAVYDALKGPCMTRAAELQSVAAGGKKGETAVSADLATCLDNMARCAEVCATADRAKSVLALYVVNPGEKEK